MQQSKTYLFILALTISVTQSLDVLPAGSPITNKIKMGQANKISPKSSQNKNDIFKGVFVKKQQAKPQIVDLPTESVEDAVVSLQKNIESINSNGVAKLQKFTRLDSKEELASIQESPTVIKNPKPSEFNKNSPKNNLPSKVYQNPKKFFSKNIDPKTNKNSKPNSEGTKKIDTGSPIAKKAISDPREKASNSASDKKTENLNQKPTQIPQVSPHSKLGLTKKNIVGNNSGSSSPIANNERIKNQAPMGENNAKPIKIEPNSPETSPLTNLQKNPSNGLLTNKSQNKPPLYKKLPENRSPKNDSKLDSLSNDDNQTTNKDTNQTGDEPVEIAWELGLIKSYLMAKKKDKAYAQLKGLIAKATSILKMYLSTTTNQPIIKIPPGPHCGVMIKTPLQVKAKLLIIVEVMAGKNYNPDAIASAKACYLDRNSDRAYSGVMRINPVLMIQENASQIEIHQYLMTIVHETLHVFAFYGNQDKLFAKSIDPHYTHLQTIKDSGHLVFDGHWSEQYIPEDIMTHYERPNSIITVHSLEVLGHKSSAYRPNFEKLPANHFLDSLENVPDFFNYQCKDDDLVAKYDVFCTKKQLEIDERNCSSDYQFKTYCDEELLSNNCYRKAAFEQGSCTDPTHDVSKYEFEHVGSDSRCFVDSKSPNSYCLKFAVIDEKVNIIINNQTYECKEDNQIIDFKYSLGDRKFYVASIKCPNIKHFIAQYKKTSCPEDCNHNGFCSNGQCLCFDGFDSKTNCKTSTHSTNIGLLFSEALK